MKNKLFIKKLKGFTLIELIITISIIAVLGVIASINLVGYREVRILDSAAKVAEAAVKSAQQKAISQENASQWGVNFVRQGIAPDYYNIYYGTSSATGIITAITTIPSSVRINMTTDLIFSKLKGSIPQQTVIVLYLASNPNINRVITVAGNGVIDIESNLSEATLVWDKTTIDTPGLYQAGYDTRLVFGNDGYGRILHITDDSFLFAALEFVRCTNESCSGKTRTTVINSLPTGHAIALGQDGYPRIAYFFGGIGSRFVRCTNDNCTASTTTAFSGGANIKLSIAPDGYARITNRLSFPARIRFTQCQNQDCVSPLSSTITLGDSSVRASDMALDAQGYGAIVYSGDGYDPKFIRCYNADCSSRSSPIVVDSSADVSVFGPGAPLRIGIGNDGYARIVYIDSNAGGSVKFIRCRNNDCSDHTTPLVLYSPSVSRNVSIAMGLDDLPRIVFHAETPNDLFYIQCRDQDCSENNLFTIDSNGNAGESNWLAIGPDGKLAISYRVFDSSVPPYYMLRYAYTKAP